MYKELTYEFSLIEYISADVKGYTLLSPIWVRTLLGLRIIVMSISSILNICVGFANRGLTIVMRHLTCRI